MRVFKVFVKINELRGLLLVNIFPFVGCYDYGEAIVRRCKGKKKSYLVMEIQKKLFLRHLFAFLITKL